MNMNRDEMIEWIKQHHEFVRKTEDFGMSNGENGIWVSGESGDEFEGEETYSYWSENHEERTFGVLNKWESELLKRGWYSEWYDAGTVMIYED